MARKTYRSRDFCNYLDSRLNMSFDYGPTSCPLAKWTGRRLTRAALDRLPGWCNRFVGCWDEAAVNKIGNCTGADALRMLREVTTEGVS